MFRNASIPKLKLQHNSNSELYSILFQKNSYISDCLDWIGICFMLPELVSLYLGYRYIF